MAYIGDNFVMVSQPIGGIVPRLFFYLNSEADSDATLVGAGFISDGVTKGARVGDLVDAVNTGTAKYKRYQVASASGAAITIAAPTAIT